jgi:hypothetical protein
MMQVGPDEAAGNFCRWFSSCPTWVTAAHIPQWTPFILWLIAAGALIYIFFWPVGEKASVGSQSQFGTTAASNSPVSNTQSRDIALQDVHNSTVTISNVKGISNLTLGIILTVVMALVIGILWLLRPPQGNRPVAANSASSAHLPQLPPVGQAPVSIAPSQEQPKLREVTATEPQPTAGEVPKPIYATRLKKRLVGSEAPRQQIAQPTKTAMPSDAPSGIPGYEGETAQDREQLLGKLGIEYNATHLPETRSIPDQVQWVNARLKELGKAWIARPIPPQENIVGEEIIRRRDILRPWKMEFLEIRGLDQVSPTDPELISFYNEKLDVSPFTWRLTPENEFVILRGYVCIDCYAHRPAPGFAGFELNGSSVTMDRGGCENAQGTCVRANAHDIHLNDVLDKHDPPSISAEQKPK